MPQLINLCVGCRKTLKEYDSFSIAMACLFLGAKVENNSKILREVELILLQYGSNLFDNLLSTQVIDEFFKMYLFLNKLPRFELDLGSELYSLWKQELLALECEVLKEIGFSCYEDLDHPHYYILDVWELFKAMIGGEILLNSTIQYSLNILNDIMFFDVISRYDSLYIAVAATLITLEVHNYSGVISIFDGISIAFRLDSGALFEVKSQIQRSLFPLTGCVAISDCMFDNDQNVSMQCLESNYLIPYGWVS